MKILLFGGTSEGHTLSERLTEGGHLVTCCVASGYGRDVLEPKAGLTIHTGRLEESQMEALMHEGFDAVIDATHPYAAQVSENIRNAALAAGIPCQRLVRPREEGEDQLFADSPEAAAKMLGTLPGNILLTTGSKDLKVFTKVPDYQERVWVRVLPSLQSLSLALSLGYPAKHIICMQGPFSEELNCAMLKMAQAKILVTKDTGKPGGFPEKLMGAKKAGAKVLTIRRPGCEEGLTLEQLLKIWMGGKP